MRRLIGIVLAMALAVVLRAQAPADSLRHARLGEKVDGYVEAIAAYPLAQQEEECDFLIRACADSLDRQFVAVRLYDRYLHSKLLGAENVAVHILDEWFFSGRVEMYDELDYFNAMVYAEFNRSSLIGAEAPALTLQRPEGDSLSVLPSHSGRYTLLYFYSPGCATCRLTTPRLDPVLKNYREDVDFYAVNTEGNRDAWAAYLDEYPAFRDAATHLWDPELHSDFQRKYGVTQTPQLVLVSPQGTILGRRLDPEALQTLLSQEIDIYEGPLWEEAVALIDKVMAVYGEYPTEENVSEVLGLLRNRTEDNVGNYKLLTAALLNYTLTHQGHGLRFGADRIAREDVLARPEVWTTGMDRLMVVEPARLSVSLMDLAPIGERLPKLRVHGTLLRGDSSRSGRFPLRRLCSRESRVVFYSRTCHECQALMDGLEDYCTSHPKTRVLLLDMDALSQRYPAEAQALLKAVDLSTLPMVFAVGRRGLILDKYLDNL